MVTKSRLSDTPKGRRSRLNYLISLGFGSLNDDLRSELDALVAADVDEWRHEVGRRLTADIASGRFTRHAIAQLLGMHESYIGRCVSSPNKISERIMGLLSLLVPGYGDVYAEFRRRADQIYLPATEQILAAAERDASRLNELTRELQAQLPAALAALAKIKELSGKVGPNDV